MLAPTPDNCALLFIDLQADIVVNSRTVTPEKLRKASGALAKLAALHELPAFVSAVPPGGAFFDEVLVPLGRPTPRPRTQTTAFSDAGLVEALQASGRKVLLIAGCASEIAVQRAALDALGHGFGVQVVVDACGGVSERTEAAAWRRIGAAGGVTTSVPAFAAELAGDFTTELGGATLALMYEALGA